MAYNSDNRSERLLQGRRFTTDNLSLGQEAFTDVFDLGAGEIFTDDGLIPTGSTQLAYSGSSQDGGVVSGSVVNPSIGSDVSVLKYHYRKKLKQAADGQREVYYFTTSNPSSVSDTVTSDQLIETDQQTNFVSPKYVIASDSPNNTESSTPGYKVVVYKDTSATAAGISASPSDPAHYVFDFKTGVLTWVSNAPAANQFVYITVYQYIGRTLRSQIDDGSIGGGGSDITVQEEGSSLSTAATTLNFVGSGVTATGNGATKTITINTAGSTLDIDTQVDGTAITVEATDKLIISDAGTEKKINVSQLFDSADFDTEVTANSAVTANTAKTGISSAQASAITANTSKTGITSGQASAITANTSKTGITSGQTSAITANTAKTGISSAQTSAITANTAKVTYPTADSTKVGHLTVTQAVNLDTIEAEASRTSIWNVSSPAGGQYGFSGPGLNGTENKPAIYLMRGEKYRFAVSNASGHPFFIQTSAGAYNSGNVYSDGVTNNGTQSGNIEFNVQFDAPDTLYYVCQYHSGMGNAIHILNKRVNGLISGSDGIVAGLVGQDLNIGQLTATKVVTNVVSQSISFATGSNIFGDEQTDIHQITGSLNITGSINFLTLDGGNF